MPTNPTVVLVHGAFADASGYAGIIRIFSPGILRFERPGTRFVASLLTRCDQRYVSSIDGPIVLVRNSYGGASFLGGTSDARCERSRISLCLCSRFGESCASVKNRSRRR